MLRKIKFIIIGSLLSALLMIVIVQSFALSARQSEMEISHQLAIFGDVFEQVRSLYVTTPDEKKLIQNAIRGMLSSLDPHSSYLDADEAREMLTSTKGEFGGLGIEVTMEKDAIKVIAPIADTPADRAGVLAGDFIVKINEKEVRGQTFLDAVESMRGDVGTDVKLSLIRKGIDKPIELIMQRAIIKVMAVRYQIENDIGYVRIIQFNEKTYGDLSNAIENIKSKLSDDILKGYVLDLRLNPGGLLDQAIDVVDAFLERGEIVSIHGNNNREITHFYARSGDQIHGKPIVVLINGGSASASEIVAGALQDHRRATILGTRSFGKGSVQTVIPLRDNSALRLTTALYYTPSGHSIQGKGITPDIMIEQPLPAEFKNYQQAYGESCLQGHIKGDEEDEDGSGSASYVPKDQKEDVQLHEAFKLLRRQR